MSRPASKETWLEARRLFEVGHSLTDIQDITNIDKASISKRSRKEAWEKGKFQQLIHSSVKNKLEISTLPIETQQLVESEIEDKTKSIIRYNSYQDKLAAVGMAMIVKKLDDKGNPNDELSPMELNSIANVVEKSRHGVVGKLPDTAIQINNNGATSAVTTMTRADRERRLKELMNV